MDDHPLHERLAAARLTATSSDGQVTATVDGLSQLVDIRLGNAIMSRDPSAVAKAVLDAVRQAQQRAQEHCADQVAAGQFGPDPRRLAAALDEISLAAERRLAELGTTLSDVARRIERSR